MKKITQGKISYLREFSKKIKKNILDMALVAGSSSSHLGGALSITDILTVLFSKELDFDFENKDKNKRDRFILSKGHACLSYYSVLSEIGFISKSDLKTFEKEDSDLPGHPVKNDKFGIDFSTGSLGMGLSLGIGVAISLKKKNNNSKVITILGDGECNEGSVWEAAMSAPNFKLDNLYVVVDNNNFQQTGTNQEIMDSGNLKNKWENFGWFAKEIDGHNFTEIYDFFNDSKTVKKPKALIAKTIKGKGFSFSENNNEWHHSILTKSLYDQAIKELNNYDKN